MNNILTQELGAIIKHWPAWFMLGNQDIKLRYRRSSLGPLWITISMAVTIYSMGFLYGHLFKINVEHYFPYLATGIIGWSLISTMITESNSIFIESESYIRNQETFLSLFMMRMILRNTIVFLHNIVVFIPLIFIFHLPIGFNMLLIIPGLLLIAINGFCWGSLLAIIGTRYRDFAQIVNSIVQVIFFLTPIMWMPSLLPAKYQWCVLYNPFEQFLNLIRLPMMNQMFGSLTLIIVFAVTLLGFALYAICMKKHKYNIVFWL